MKKKIYLGIAAVIFVGSLISGTLYSGGSPGAKTNSPLDGGNCSQCHSSTVTSRDWITSDIPVTGYVPGETYTITAAGDHSGAVKFGFEVTAEDASSKVGTFLITNATETKLANSDNSVTHTSDGNTASGGTKTWNFDWTAPTTGTGDVTFYGAFNAADGSGNTSGDVIYTSTLAVNEDLTVGIDENEITKISISPNPANDILTIKAANIIETIRIINISGKEIINFNDVSSKSKTINIGLIPAGIYLLNIEGENFSNSEKIIIK